MKKHNFSAGPSILPTEVFKEASQAIIDFENTGLSILEISHRSEPFLEVMHNARCLALDLAGLNEDYQVLYLQGGASLQFLSVAYNLLENKALYIDTGTWSSKAIKEAKAFGKVEVIASSKEDNYRYIPKQYTIPTDADYLHLTTNNTIYGTEFHCIPQTDVPLVADMSSDIFSRKWDYSKFSLVYAGAQKNLGPSGTTLILIKKDILGKVSRHIPSMLNYQVQIDNESMFNTPTTFAIYATLLTLKWIKNNGGLQGMETRNKAKAALLYSEIDRNPLIRGHANAEDRSLMNVVFNIIDEEKHKERFDFLCKEAGISGIKGHRSVGGYRASIYNAMPIESVQILVDVLKELERKA